VIQIARLHNMTNAPLRFRLGDRVVWKHRDDAASRDVQGTIMDGTCIYNVNGGPRLPPIRRDVRRW